MGTFGQWLSALLRPSNSWRYGVLGSLTILATMLITAVGYRGRLGELYSPLNHFVSELGEVGVSPLAWVFNYGLLLGGLALVVFLAGVGRRMGGWQGWLFTILGVACGISGALVGAFPMNYLAPHAFWASNFFNLGLVCMLLFSVIVLQGGRSLPRSLAIPGLLATIAFGAFLYMPQTASRANTAGTLADIESLLGTLRPPFWNMAVFEWLAVGSVLAWALVVALALRKVRPAI